MNYIDDLFHEIKENEEVEDKNSMDKEKQHRIENRIMESIKFKNEKVEKKDCDKLRKIISKKKLVVLLAAVIFLLGMTVFSAKKYDWDTEIVKFMGISNADTMQLDNVEVEIGVSAFSNGVTMKAVNSIGDKNSAYIRIDTDYKLPQDFNEQTDYILPDDWKTSVASTRTSNSDHGGTLNCFNNKGYLSFMMYISNCEGINKKNVTVSFDNLYLYHDLGMDNSNEPQERALIASGEWTLTWKYNYKSNINTYYPIKFVKSKGDTCFVSKIEISPITIRAEAVKNPWEGTTESSMLIIKKITMKDGSVIEFDSDSTSGGCTNNTFLDGYRDVIEMGKAINTSNIYSITIGDSEIILQR